MQRRNIKSRVHSNSMLCQHFESGIKNLPSKASSLIYKDDCEYCFDNPESENGLDICLACFRAFCGKHGKFVHKQSNNHKLFLNIKKTKCIGQAEDRPKKLTKVVIEEGAMEELKFEEKHSFHCGECDLYFPMESANASEIQNLAKEILNSTSAAKKSDIKAWEEKIVPCEHTLTLTQEPITNTVGLNCDKCELKENLWLCLTCGNVGCGRKQYDGSGGNNHGNDHFKETCHPVSCKLGTITPEGEADVYCYLCDDMKQDPYLASHLSAFGIAIESQQKTEKSLQEMQLEQNLKFDFSMATSDGKTFEPVFGPGFTGLKNLGNSCYMASVIQAIFSLSDIRRFYMDRMNHFNSCTTVAAKCYNCQTIKLVEGLSSGRYCTPAVGENNGQNGISPASFKNFIGQDHPEFSTMRQQDAYEFFCHLCQVSESKERNDSPFLKEFSYEMTQIIQCGTCQKYSLSDSTSTSMSLPISAKLVGSNDGKDVYESSSLEKCLQKYFAKEDIEFTCPSCKDRKFAKKWYGFKSYPKALVLQTQRFVLKNWLPQKIDISLSVPVESLNVTCFHSIDSEIPDQEIMKDAAKSALPTFDENHVQQLMEMGFSRIRCEKALFKTNNQGPDIAMNWLFEHMEDPDIDEPIVADGGSEDVIPEDLIATVMSMGFAEAQAKKALKKSSLNVEAAIDWLFSNPNDSGEDAKVETSNSPIGGQGNGHYRLQAFISHKGTSVSCGHYVAHVWSDTHKAWILFNDNKVAIDPNPDISAAYLYLYR